MAIGIRIEGISRRFGNVHALDDVSVEIGAGEFFTILGSSGSGKSTLLKLIGGFDKPDRGRVLFDGKDVSTVPANRRPVNTVFQDLGLFPHMSVAQNVGYGLKVQNLPGPAIARRLTDALALVDLTGFEERRVTLLSGGQRQRVALARALIMEPGILLLDEPLTGLDERLREQMRDEFGRLHRRTGATFVLVTHNHDEALSLSDRMAVMHNGRIAQVDTPQRFFDAPANAFVARFVGIDALLMPESIATDGRSVLIGGQSIAVRGTPFPGALVAIRPDRVALAHGSEADQPLQLSISDIQFRGLHSDVRARFTDGQDLVVQMPCDMAATLACGDPLHLWLRPGCAVLVAEQADVKP